VELTSHKEGVFAVLQAGCLSVGLSSTLG